MGRSLPAGWGVPNQQSREARFTGGGPRTRKQGMRSLALLPPLCLLSLTLAACSAGAPAPRAAPTGAAPRAAPTGAARIAAECALLTQAGTMMAAAGNPAHDGLLEGCPGSTARDTRPLARQTASLRDGGQAALPPGVTQGSRGEAVFRRMITRGVPVSLASQLTADPLFAEAAR